MSDLEIVLIKLQSFKEDLNKSPISTDKINELIKFIDKLIILFNTWNVLYNIAGGDGNLTLNNILSKINTILIHGK